MDTLYATNYIAQGEELTLAPKGITQHTCNKLVVTFDGGGGVKDDSGEEIFVAGIAAHVYTYGHPQLLAQVPILYRRNTAQEAETQGLVSSIQNMAHCIHLAYRQNKILTHPHIICGDSKNAISHMFNESRISSDNLQSILLHIKECSATLPYKIQYKHIPRSNNIIADQTANLATHILAKANQLPKLTMQSQWPYKIFHMDNYFLVIIQPDIFKHPSQQLPWQETLAQLTGNPNLNRHSNTSTGSWPNIIWSHTYVTITPAALTLADAFEEKGNLQPKKFITVVATTMPHSP